MTTDSTVINITAGQLTALSKSMKLNEIRAALPELEAACNAKIEVAERFADLVKLVSLKAGVNSSVLATYITAVCQDTLAKKEAQTEQLSILFSELD